MSNLILPGGIQPYTGNNRKQLQFQIVRDPKTGLINLQFNQPILAMGLNAEQARTVAYGLLDQASVIDPFQFPEKLILVLDFDGVIHNNQSKWTSTTDIPDPPVDGALEAINEYIKHFTVAVFGSRSATGPGIIAMQQYMFTHGFPVNSLWFPREKPAAYFSIDDRGFQFNGEFPSPDTIFKFKAWNKRQPDERKKD